MFKIKVNKIFFIVGMFFLSESYMSQSGIVKGRVFDQMNNKAIPFANIYIERDGDGKLQIKPPRSDVGDYLEFTAEMDVLVALSVCPDDITPINDHDCKAVKVEILD